MAKRIEKLIEKFSGLSEKETMEYFANVHTARLDEYRALVPELSTALLIQHIAHPDLLMDIFDQDDVDFWELVAAATMAAYVEINRRIPIPTTEPK